MSKSQLKFEISRYIAFGYSIKDACKQINNLYLNKYLTSIFDIQNELLTKCAK